MMVSATRSFTLSKAARYCAMKKWSSALVFAGLKMRGFTRIYLLRHLQPS